jgi:ABC transport system ATP-binding/permease protein
LNLVSLEKVTKRHAEKLVLDGVTLGVGQGERVGVIGLNGSGKSTLLRIVAGVEEPDAGRVAAGSHVRRHYLAQDPTMDPDHTALEAVLAADTPLTRTVREYERLMGVLALDPRDAEATRRLDSMQAAMDAVGGWALEHRAKGLLARLGVTDLHALVATCSGGQLKRIALARALLDDVELLILDEPTNHLDVDAVEWLEAELLARSAALLVVTHDRYLLDRLTNRIVEVHSGRLQPHAGSYAEFLEARLLREAQAEAADRRRANRARTELAWLRRTPAARTGKSRHRTRQAEALLTSGVEATGRHLALGLPSRRLGGKVVHLHNVGKRFGQRWVLRGVDYRLGPDARVGIVGPNGAGKTTLLRLMAGLVEPDQGSVRMGETVHVGWYGQEPVPLPPRQRVLQALEEVVLETRADGVRVSAAQLLERFGFPPVAQKAHVGELSGGERRRLELLRVLGTAPNLLLLDEPTNDLDLETLGTLEEYLDDWPGALVVATHDRFLLDRVCHDLFAIQPDGTLRHHPGGWTAWRRQQTAERAEERAGAGAGHRSAVGTGGAPAVAAAERAVPVTPRKLKFHERRELTELERRIPELVAVRDTLAASLQEAGDDHAAASRIGEELARTVAELDAAECRWLELASIGEGSA